MRKKKFLAVVLSLLLAAVALPISAVPAGAETDGDYEYEVWDDGGVSVEGYHGAGGDVEIPDALGGCPVTGIYPGAFAGRTDLTSVAIPDSVRQILPLEGCTGLTAYHVKASHPSYIETDGVLFGKDENNLPTTLCLYPCGRQGAYAVPDGVQCIDTHSFTGCAGLTSIVIPDSVIRIGYRAFSGCTGLTSINISAKIETIGSNAFEFCTSLTAINVDEDNPNYASADGALLSKDGTQLIQCPAGKEGSFVIPNTVTSVDWGAFMGCEKITSLTISAGMTNIGSGAFAGCTGLTEFRVDPKNQSYTSMDGSLLSNDGTTLVQCPFGAQAYSVPDCVTTLGRAPFSGCAKLTSIYIPAGVKSSNGSGDMFASCTELTEFEVSGDNQVYKSVDGVMFSKDGKKLYHYPINKEGTSYAVPGGVERIWDYAFPHCKNLTSVTLADSVAEIMYSAFSGCAELVSVTFGSGLQTIGQSSFFFCPKLTGVTFPDGLTEIGTDAFERCTGLTSIVIPDSVTKIGWMSFNGCTGLTSIEIGSGVREIEYHAFGGCTGLTEVALPASLETVGEAIFSNCAGLVKIETDPANTHFMSVDGVLFSKNDEGQPAALLLYPAGKKESVYAVPDGVTDIKNQALGGCCALTLVTLPDSVVNIESYAFSGCKSLTSIVIPDSVTSIGSAFTDCKSLTSIVIPDSVTSIGGSAFSGCTGLTSVTIGDGVTSIGSSVFYGCTGLTSITIPAGVTKIDDGAFGSSPELTIYGYAGSAAETYANENGISFVDLNAQQLVHEETGVTVTGATSAAIPESTSLKVEQKAATATVAPFDITLVNESGEPVQPSGSVTVRIPVPDGWDGWNCKVYREEGEGAYTNMHAAYDGAGFMVFATDHFSVYDVTLDLLIPIYAISYNSNGGEGAPGLQIKEQGETLTLSSDVPTRENYEFLGWATASDATEAEYQPGGSFAADADTVLYAVWKAENLPCEHSWGEWVVTVPPTATQDGVETRTCALCGRTETRAVPHFLLGDVNGDDMVDAGDAVLVLRHDAELIRLEGVPLAAGDVNGDDMVDAGDAVLILRYDAQLITGF